MTQEEKLKIEREIARNIGYFYFNRDQSGSIEERVARANEEVEARKITRIEFDGKNIHVTSSRPGLLIGHHGKEIDSLVAYLHTLFTFDTLNIIEERTLGNLYSFQYALGIH